MKDQLYYSELSHKLLAIMNEKVEEGLTELIPVGCGGYVYKWLTGEFKVTLTKRFDDANKRQKHPIMTITKKGVYCRENACVISTKDHKPTNPDLLEEFVFSLYKPNRIVQSIKKHFYV